MQNPLFHKRPVIKWQGPITQAEKYVYGIISIIALFAWIRSLELGLLGKLANGFLAMALIMTGAYFYFSTGPETIRTLSINLKKLWTRIFRHAPSRFIAARK
jgi:hypothetical protein